jgi:transforming growth factor-beta-induced protein
MNKNKNVWIGTVAILVVAALIVWWMADRLPISTWTGWVGGEKAATTTEEVGGTATGGTATGAAISKVSRSTQSVNAIIAGLSGTSQFNSLYNSTGVAASVTSTGKYTVFVPTNGAFAQLAGGTISSMTGTEKKRLVQYHVVSGRAIDVDTQIAGTIEALSRDMLNFSFGANKIPMVNSAIIITEYTGKNGTVYLVDNVLLPPKKAPGSL